MKCQDDQQELVEICFEVGHVSIIRTGTTTNPTHDWKVFLRSSVINGDLNCLIERCVFHLHSSFINRKRELKETPFAIKESGSEGFSLLIEIFFKTKNEPRQYKINYQLDLHENVDGGQYRPKVSYLRKYRCIFSNPDADLRAKILAAGGKIVDSGPMIDDDDDRQETKVRISPPKKRAISPASSTQLTSNSKKLKVQTSPTNDTKKKATSTSVKTVVTAQKTPTPPTNTSKITPTKPLKITLTKDTKTNEATKVRSSTKIVKTQSSHEIKSSVETKRKETNSSPTKIKTNSNSQTVTKKLPNLSIKLDGNLNPVGKSPVSPPPAPSSSLPFDKQKKIPKKSSLPSTTTTTKIEKPTSRASIDSSSLNRSTVRSTQKVTTKKVNAPLKRESSLPNINANKSQTSTNSKDNVSSRVSEQTKISKDSSSKCAKSSIKKTISDRIVSKSIDIPSSSNSLRVEPPSQDLPVSSPSDTVGSSIIPSTTNSPSVEQLQLSEDEMTNDQMPIPTTFKSDLIVDHHLPSTENPTDDDLDIDDEDDDDLPTGLTDVDLRYKLIYIYNRFRSQSMQDLNIFVRFFKRHHLIDSSALAMNSNTDNMFTYDLFSLSPSHIGELAHDLGYIASSTV